MLRVRELELLNEIGFQPSLKYKRFYFLYELRWIQNRRQSVSSDEQADV